MSRRPAVAIAAAIALAGCGATHAKSAPSSTAATAPATSTTTVLTTVAPTTSAPGAAPSTTPAPTSAPTTAPSRQAALDAVVAGYHGTYASSGFAGQDRQQLVAVDHDTAAPNGGTQVEVDVYSWSGTALTKVAAVELGNDADVGQVAAASAGETPITVVAVTGSATPDFAVTTEGASEQFLSLVSDATGTWRAVPFVGPDGTTLGVPNGTVNGATVRASFASCNPNCAQGASTTVVFTYRAGQMARA